MEMRRFLRRAQSTFSKTFTIYTLSFRQCKSNSFELTFCINVSIRCLKSHLSSSEQSYYTRVWKHLSLPDLFFFFIQLHVLSQGTHVGACRTQWQMLLNCGERKRASTHSKRKCSERKCGFWQYCKLNLSRSGWEADNPQDYLISRWNNGLSPQTHPCVTSNYFGGQSPKPSCKPRMHTYLREALCGAVRLSLGKRNQG